MALRFAVTGVAGFVAPRHLEAIKSVGGELVAALDPHDAVGILDKYSRNVAFFTDQARFERYLAKLQHARTPVDWLSVCAPNHLHDVHALMGMRSGANVICEKPLTLSPWNLDVLEKEEIRTGRRVYTVLQLRLMPQLIALRKAVLADTSAFYNATLEYQTPRGDWYQHSWKGDVSRSGGVITNIGIHLLDMLIWTFGDPDKAKVHRRDATGAAGTLRFHNAEVDWTLSTGGSAPRREISVTSSRMHDVIKFVDGFAELHTEVYQRTLSKKGFTIADARPAVVLAHRLRTVAVSS